METANGATDYMVGKVYVSRDAKNYNYVGLSDSASVLLDLRDNPVNAQVILCEELKYRNMGFNQRSKL